MNRKVMLRVHKKKKKRWWGHAHEGPGENNNEYQALDNLEQLLHHNSNALVTKKTTNGLEVRWANKVPVGAVYVRVGNVQRLGGKEETKKKSVSVSKLHTVCFNLCR